jgi:hypothetical protein
MQMGAEERVGTTGRALYEEVLSVGIGRVRLGGDRKCPSSSSASARQTDKDAQPSIQVIKPRCRSIKLKDSITKMGIYLIA